MATTITEVKVSETIQSTGTALHKQYGGVHAGKWVDLLPASWQPFIQLARLSPPAALILIYFPHLFGIIYGAIATDAPADKTLRTAALLFVSNFFWSSATHAWDDWVDVPIDKLIPRTQKRPIVRGAVSPRAALLFTLSQAFIGSFLFVIDLPPVMNICSLFTIAGSVYYPFAKRHIPCPQAVLGYVFGNGVVVGAAAMGISPLEDHAVLYLALASALWVVIYDTVYGSIDMKDDMKHNIGNTAILLGSQTKFWFTVFLGILVSSLGVAGQLSGFSLPYYLISMVGCGVSMGVMISRVELQNSASCWWWFAHGFWMFALSITAALLTEYTPGGQKI